MSLNLDKDSILDVSCEFKENLNTLRQIPFFSKLPMEKLKLFAYLCSQRTYKPGDYLFSQGEDDGQAFYIISGQAELVHASGETEVVVRHYGKTSFLGGMAILGRNNRIFSLRAMDPVTCLVLEREKVKRILEEFPELVLPAMQACLDNVHAWEKHFLSRHAGECPQCCRHIGVSVL